MTASGRLSPPPGEAPPLPPTAQTLVNWESAGSPCCHGPAQGAAWMPTRRKREEPRSEAACRWASSRQPQAQHASIHQQVPATIGGLTWVTGIEKHLISNEQHVSLYGQP